MISTSCNTRNESSKQFFSREFNNVQHCHKRDVIVKTSKDQDRLTAGGTILKNFLKHYKAFSLTGGKPEEKSALVMEAILSQAWQNYTCTGISGPTSGWVLERLRSIQSDFIAAKPAEIGSSSWLYSEKLKSMGTIQEVSQQRLMVG